jgi:hypothetical protein
LAAKLEVGGPTKNENREKRKEGEKKGKSKILGIISIR